MLRFEPDESACEKLRCIYAARGSGHKYRVLPAAPAGDNAERTLHVTNSPSGASLFNIDTPMVQAYVERGYLYPIARRQIRTRNATEAFHEMGVSGPHLVKLDVQGMELKIRQAFSGGMLHSTIAVQLEAAFHPRCPDYPIFGDTDTFMRDAGFELWDLEPVRVHRTLRGRRAGYLKDVFRVNLRSPTVAGRIWETDALYYRPPESLVDRGDENALRRLVVCYGIYGLFTEAFHTLSVAEDCGLIALEMAQSMKGSIRRWHSRSTWRAWFTRGAAGRGAERFADRFRRKQRPIRGAIQD